MPRKFISLLFTQSMAALTAVWLWNRTICLRLRLLFFCSTKLMAQPRALSTFGPNCIYRQPGSHAQRGYFLLKTRGLAGITGRIKAISCKAATISCN